jgi:hypothetical protein
VGQNIVCLKKFPGTGGLHSGVLEYRDRVIRLGEYESWEDVRGDALDKWKLLFPEAKALLECVATGFPRTPTTFMATHNAVDALTQSRILEMIYFEAMERARAAIEGYEELLRSIEENGT